VRQALSAVGQTALMRRWQDALGTVGLAPAQVLLTADVTEDRQRYLNARAAFRVLHGAGLVPVVNENDAVATEELRHGDNDGLAARTAGLIGADTLVLLSDVDGLYTAPPGTEGARHVPFVSREAAASLDLSSMGSVSGVGTGGMASKVQAARLASSWGVRVVIASGREARPLLALAEGEARGTVFKAAGEGASARWRWLSGQARPAARLSVDEGAARALRGGASLLAVGVTEASSGFAERGLVAIEGPDGPLGFGLAACDSSDIGTPRPASLVVVHRDDLVLE
jgi:glutamate 5-kinase